VTPDVERDASVVLRAGLDVLERNDVECCGGGSRHPTAPLDIELLDIENLDLM
jgi:hypothetical protein